MKVRVSEASGPVLDWMVGMTGEYGCGFFSTDWSAGGPIIEHHIFRLSDYDDPEDPGRWRAEGADGAEQYGPTALIAAMRAYVCSKLGEEVEVPDELA